MPEPIQDSSPQSEKRDKEKAVGKLSILNDLYVDLLGCLVPGLFTVILGVAVLFLTLVVLYSSLSPKLFTGINSQGPFLTVLKDLLTGFHWEIGTIIIVSGYVIGSIFFRQDPKKPDANSAIHVWMNSTKVERCGLAVQVQNDKLPKTLKLKSDKGKLSLATRLKALFRPQYYIKLLDLDTQFPYLHLKCYLAARGLTHLLPRIPWCPKESETKGFRTKMFINILKIRIQALSPDMCRDIVRNEAHVRLATSVWYATTFLQWLSSVALLIIFSSIATCSRDGMMSVLFLPLAFTTLLLLICVAIRYYLRKCIHYMRVREVIYVLETANLAEKFNEGIIFEGLSSKDNSHKCMDLNLPPVACVRR